MLNQTIDMLLWYNSKQISNPLDMNFEIKPNLEKQETIIDLSDLEVVFCDDDFITSYYQHKQSEFEDKDRWIEENKESISQDEKRIAKAIEDGRIPDGNPETIWKYKHERINREMEKALAIKKELEGRKEEMNAEVSKRLAMFLPDWKAESATVNFTMNEDADFCIDGNRITADIARLVWENQPVERFIEGITHEVFHIWMRENAEMSKGRENIDAVKSDIIFGIVNEGLAVLVSGQNLAKHHERQGRNYEEYKKESLRAFEELLEESDIDEAERFSSEAFKNMGHAYVVGNEIAKEVLRKIGLEKFRKLIEECRTDPQRMIDEYRAE